MIDEKLGRKIAKLNNIKVVGSLGVLIEAKKKRILPSIKPHVEILRASSIYFSSALLDHALKMANEAVQYSINPASKQKKRGLENDIMLTKEKITEILRESYPHLMAKYGVKRLGLFGSYAKGEQNEDSDVDLVAEFERPIGLRFIEFAEYIERILGKRADILTPEGIRRITIKRIAQDIEQSIIYV